MTTRRTAAVMVTLAGALAVAGCSNDSSGGAQSATAQIKPVHHPRRHPASPPLTPTDSPTPMVTVTATVTSAPAPTPTATPTVTPTSTPTPAPTPTSGPAENLTAGRAVRIKLVKAGAASHGLPASDFTGLVPGRTYYAYDPGTATYWAGAGLVPSESSMAAQVAVQDDGSYLIFSRSATGGFKANNVGLAGVAGSDCPVTVPASVLKAWHWAKHTCRPPG